ncbi:neuraminidase-like domain-containing protein [Moorena sp. SIO4G3]|uniref:Tc toxin subunit A-related protein n=1 Tax=Moorena sp. SIO4G3 TaxID=2607821 RepID=UPI00142B2734|nr:neuraminidase-like domain-containing protein [Moorena sp. SIO4G3]NEO79936.1 hypothetical protein [Moorena sp. SIO4G3]
MIERLANFLGSSTDILQALVEDTIYAIIPDKTEDPDNISNFDDIKKYIFKLRKWLFISQKLKLNSVEIDGITHFNDDVMNGGVFLEETDIITLKNTYTLKQLIKAFNDNQNDFIQYLAEPSDEKIAEITGWEEAQIGELGEVLQETNINFNSFNLVEIIAKFKQVFDLNKSLGANISFYGKVLSLLNVTEGRSLRDWVNSMEVVQSILHLVKAKYNDDEWEKVSEKFDSHLNEVKRNVLANFALWKLNQKDDSIKNLRNLSEYLLIDVETTGCASVSYIKQAILSLQMYLQRCRMNLEPGVTQVNIPEVWWQWIMNYRIWEANRKVFLYPENYIDPSLRHTKTSLFQELESELLQSDITQESVEQAYQNYFNKFAELAQLKPAASYRCTVEIPNSSESQDTLFLFGRTASEPYTYYYQECINPTVNKPTWTAWNKIDLTINSDYINVTYAFNKLFIFWVEITKTKQTRQEDGKTIKKNETKATIKYSFHKVGKQWMQPQTLAKDIVIEDYEENYDESNPQVNLWHKVCALPIPGNESEEKILTLFGNFESYPNGFESIANVETTLTSNLLPENINVFLHNQPSGGFRSIMFNGQLQAIATRNLLYDNYNDDLKDSTFLHGPVGYWPMNDGSGGLIKDQTVHYNNGTFRGNPQWKIVNDFPGTDSRSVLEFNGYNAYISFNSSNVPIGNEPYTISVWIKPEDMRTSGIIGWGNYGSTNEVTALAIIGYSDKFISHYWRDIELNYSVDLTGQWHHVVATFDGTTRKIFLDGQEVAYDKPSGHYVPRGDNFTIGWMGSTGIGSNLYFKGLIAEVGIWDVAISAEQILLASRRSIPLITNNISTPHSYTKTIKNQPGWFTFENGDEAFLVIPQENDFKQISNSLEVTPQDNGNLTLSYNDSSDITPLSEQKFAFTRLTTSTIRQLNQKMLMGGLDHLLTPDSQLTPELDFTRFSPTENVIAPNSKQLDFDGPYGIYFWEIFFHIPFLVANTLNANQKFEEAQKWYNYIFNPTHPTYIFNPTNPTSSKGLVAYLPMDEGNGIDIRDFAEGNNKNGTLQGNVQWQEVADFPGVDSKNVLEFEGSTFIEIPDPFDDLTNFTIDVWVKPSVINDGSYHGFIGKQENPRKPGMWLAPNNGGLHYDSYTDAGERFSDILPNFFTSTDEWIQVTWVKNGEEYSFYRNGLLFETRPAPQKVYTNPASNYDIGRVDNYWQGQIAEVGIWDVALSAEEIKNLSGNNANDRFWRYLPFRGHTLEKLKGILTDEQAIQAYNNNPFDPHAIARLRIGAYEKAIVMKYIDNLLDWGDNLFAQDTWESITQATMLYLLAYDLLGHKPEDVGKCQSSESETFDDIKEQYDGKNIPQFLIELEHHVGNSQSLTLTSHPFNDINAYFCVSENEQFTAYWDRVQDRLYKIRHCENIEGVVRQLALFEPPIDPNQLVRAVAGGNTPMSVVSGLTAEVPNYRFDYMLERAKNITSTLIQLGSSLLSALEKKDAEQIALLRATQEPAILRLIQTTKEKQIKEAQANLDSLNKSLDAANNRVTHYQGLIDGGLSSHEKDNERLMESAIAFEATAAISHTISSPVYSVPTIFGFSDGGFKPADIIRAIGEAAQSTAGVLNQSSQLTATFAQFDRREEDWQLQLQIAQDEVSQIEKQIAASKINIEIATSELTSHQKSIEQADEVENFFKNKFTTTDLYQWMVSRLSTLYFQTFKIAQDMALAAQKAYQYELNQDETYIQFDYWDSLHKGLLAGESLMLGLNQLEKAYIEGNSRYLEIEKTISLLQLNPQAFQQFKDTGKCEFKLSEKLFDFDFPGHYCRQIKTIAISIPAVVGPYQNIKATLTQTSNKTLLQPNVNAVEYLLSGGENPPDESILRSNWRRNQKIAISRGANDNGLFELNFRDERYLPFEGTGAVSTWELSLPKQTNPIDFDTISDVIITLSYTALDGGDKFRKDVTNLEPLQRYSEAYYFNLKQAFPGEWHTFMNLNTDRNSQKLTFTISSEIIPPHIEDAKLTGIIFKLDAPNVSSPLDFATITLGENPIINQNDNSINDSVADNWFGDWVMNFDLTNVPGNLKKDGLLNPEIVKTIELILIYEGKIIW